MGKKTRALPNFVYTLVQHEGNPMVLWMRCPVLGLEGDLLAYGAPSAMNVPDLSVQWRPIPKEQRPVETAGWVHYAELMKAGVVATPLLDQPGGNMNVFLRPRALDDSPESAKWLAEAMRPKSTEA